MLQKLRDKTSGWIVTVILGLLMIPFLFVIDNSYLGGVGAQNVANFRAADLVAFGAVVVAGAHAVAAPRDQLQDFRTRFEQERMRERQQQGDNFDPRAFESTENKMAVLDQLIDEQVVRLVGEQAGVVIGDGAVREYIATMPAFLDSNGKFNENNYRLAWPAAAAYADPVPGAGARACSSR